MNASLLSRITNFFGTTLVPVTSPSLDHFSLPEETKTFLKSSGLPLHPGLLLQFYTQADTLDEITFEGTKFLIIGDDYGYRLGMKEHTSEIIAFTFRGTRPERFINSSILTLLAFLVIYTEAGPKLAQASDEEAVTIVARMRDEFRALDAKALDSPENWWSDILWQTEEGLL